MGSRRGRKTGTRGWAAPGRLLLRGSWALIGMALVSSRAAAQTAPFPALPPEPVVASSPDPGAPESPTGVAPGANVTDDAVSVDVSERPPSRTVRVEYKMIAEAKRVVTW